MQESKKVDLKKWLENAESRPLNGLVSFTIPTLSDEMLEELSVISEMLDKTGISVELTRHEGEGMEYDFLVLKVDKERYHTVMTRHAGRKADFNEKYDKYKDCSVAELREKLKAMSKTKIAEELGCSRMTLYRIIKNTEERQPLEDTSIWHYTS